MRFCSDLRFKFVPVYPTRRWFRRTPDFSTGSAFTLQCDENGVVKMGETLFKRKIFGFGAEHYVQFSSIAIGTKMTLPYANSFMGQLGGRILKEAILTPWVYLRRDINYSVF